MKRFADMEIFVEIQENVRGQDVFVIQSTSFPANDNLMELLILIDALKRASARRITAVIPYYGYARQDRKPGPRTPITAKLVANLIERAGADRVMTLDLHAGQIQGFFDIPTDNLFAAPVMVRDIQEQHKGNNLMVVSPDVGGVVRARALAKRIEAPIAICDKRRDRPGESEVMHVIGDVKGKRCILIDDIVDSGGTLVNAAEALLKHGAVEVMAYITHGVLSGGAVSRIQNSQAQVAGDHGFDPADRRGAGGEEHPRSVDRAADRRGHPAHRARGKRLQPVLLSRSQRRAAVTPSRAGRGRRSGRHADGAGARRPDSRRDRRAAPPRARTRGRACGPAHVRCTMLRRAALGVLCRYLDHVLVDMVCRAGDAGAHRADSRHDPLGARRCGRSLAPC